MLLLDNGGRRNGGQAQQLAERALYDGAHKVRDLAARFLEAVAGKASPDTRTHVDHALLTLE